MSNKNYLNIARVRTIAAALLILAGIGWHARQSHAQSTVGGSTAVQACKMESASVVRAYRASRGAKIPLPGSDGQKDVQLSDEIWIEVNGLPGLIACESADHPFVLFLNGRAAKRLVREPSSDPHTAIAKFTLKITSDARDTWAHVLGRPSFEARETSVSIGIQDRFPIRSDAILYVNSLPSGWFIAWVVIFFGLLLAFLWCAIKTNIIRDGQPDPAAAKWNGPYSLSRTQAAWWFFVVFASYLLIGLVTGDFVGSLNATALTLLGISAGTVLGAVAIDASKSGPAAQVAQQQAQQTSANEVRQFSAQTANLQNAAEAATDPQRKAETLQQLKDAETRLQMAKSNEVKLLNQSEGFFRDIVSDANGVIFHRFQMVAWTLALAVVFVHEVYQNLAMPEFNATLLGLIGISAGTYLGLKTTEAVVPKN